MSVENIVNINESNLQQVLEQSMTTPVLFYFWSERSQHCLQLTPILESLAAQYNGQFILAKLDCDAEQMIAAQFGLRAIPTVYLFQNGQPVDGFQGPQPEEAIRALLDKVLPREEELKAQQAMQLMQESNYTDALPLLKDAWQLSNQNGEIGLLLAETLIALNRSEDAEAVLKTIPLQDQDTRYQGLVAQIELLKQAADTPEIQQLQQQVARAIYKRRDNLVVGVFAALVFGEIAHTFQLREFVQQLLLDPFFQRHIDHGTTVTAAAKLQNGVTVFGDFHQRNATTVTSKLWVDLRLQHILHALHQRCIVCHFTHFGVRGFQC